ncbi:MAG: DUF58 domain-containing protein [Spirochaetes bacterium]|nr:DUF58 domain-containing protein [Spirochaetota bacterium]
METISGTGSTRPDSPAFRAAAPSGAMSYFTLTISILAVALTAFIAAAQASPLLASFAGALLLLLCSLRAWAALGAQRLSVKAVCGDRRVFAGETLSLNVKLENRKLLPAWISLEIDRDQALAPEAESGGETALGPFAKTSGHWSFKASRRGLYRLGPIRIVSSDPLGLCQKEKKNTFSAEIVVYPRLVPVVDPALPYRDYFGIHPAKGVIEDPAWYEGTREYTGLRPARNIHWKASARFATLLEKIFEPTSHRKAFFLLDGSGFKAAADAEGFESALEIVASLGSLLVETGASIGAVTDRLVTGHPAFLPLGRGPEHLGAFLELLARCTAEPGKNIASLMESGGIQGASLIVVEREPGPATASFFSLPATRRDRIIFVFARKPADGAQALYPFVSFSELAPAKEGKP